MCCSYHNETYVEISHAVPPSPVFGIEQTSIRRVDTVWSVIFKEEGALQAIPKENDKHLQQLGSGSGGRATFLV